MGQNDSTMQIRLTEQNVKELKAIQKASSLKPSIARLANMIISDRAGNLRVDNPPAATNFK